jgi:hypothetical protein
MSGTRTKRSTYMERLRYIVAHPYLFQTDGPGLIRALKAAGLIAPTTYFADCNPGKLLTDAEVLANQDGDHGRR